MMEHLLPERCKKIVPSTNVGINSIKYALKQMVMWYSDADENKLINKKLDNWLFSCLIKLSQ
jgi:hypothetical protein